MKRSLSIVLIALLSAFAFFTVKVDAKNEMVDYLVEKKIVEGDDSGDLKLESPIDRASFAKIVVYAIDEVELAEKLKPAPSIFKDMKADGWANGYANVSYTKKIVNGYPGNLFAPQDNVTYEQAIKMLTVVSNDGELENKEKAPGTTWATPYIEKATELGILKHLNVDDYKKEAKREDVFNMLYEVLQLKNPTVSLKIRGLVEEITEKGAKINIINPGDAKDLKKSDIKAFKFATNVNPKDFVGQVVDFNVNEKSEVTEVKQAREYELISGNFTIGKDGSLYMNGEKRGYVIDNSEKAEDRLLNIIHNGVSYSLQKYLDEVKSVDFAVVTVHNSKVVFINSFKFNDIVPVVEFNGNQIYVIKDNAPQQKAVANVKSAFIFEKGRLLSFDPNRISVDSVLHFYDDGKVIIGTDKLINVKFKLVNGEIIVGNDKYPLSNEPGFRAVLNVGANTYDSIIPTAAQPTLIAMGEKNNVIALDLKGNVQLVRGDLSQTEEPMIIDALTATQLRLKDKTNRLIEVKDSLSTEIKDGNKIIKISDLNVNDLIYVFSDENGVRKIAKVISPTEAKPVDKLGEKYSIDLAPTRGRYQLIKVDGKEYELTKDSLVLVKNAGKCEFTTLENIAKHANINKNLSAFVVTTENFENANTGVKLPVSARGDLVFAILFDNFEKVQNAKENVAVKMIYGFDQKIDKEIYAEDKDGNKKNFTIFKNATIENLNPREIVKLSIGEDGTVISAEKQITPDQRVYVIKSVLLKDNITTLEFVREDTNEQFTKVLARDAVVFGEPKEGAKMRMHVTRDDIDVLEILK